MISGDHERTALDFQKHYRLGVVHLMDTDLSFQRAYSRSGWPFLMLVDANGTVVHKANNLLDREAEILLSLKKLKAASEAVPIRTVDGTHYSTATLRRSGELDRPRARQRFSHLAAATDGRVFLVFTSSNAGHSDLWLRTWDGRAWSDNQAVAASLADEYDGTVSAGPDGKTWFCWTSNHGGDKYNIFVTDLDRLNAGKDPIQVTQADDDAMSGRLACESSGALWITYYKWQKNQAGISRDKEVFVRRLRNGALSAEVRISPTDVPSYEDHTDPAIAIVGGAPLVCWSWDYHRPKGYPRDAESPTIFLSTVSNALKPAKPFHASGHGIDMVPVLAAQGNTAWCAWDSLVYGRSRLLGKSLIVRRVATAACAGEPVVLAKDMEHLCSPCLAFGPAGRTVLLWCQKPHDKDWELCTSECRDGETWSKAKPLVTAGNPRYGSVALDASGALWISYTADTERGRQVKVERPEANSP